MKAEIADILKTQRKDKFWAFILQTDFPLTLNLGLVSDACPFTIVPTCIQHNRGTI